MTDATDTAPARRLTLSQIVEQLIAQRGRERSAVTITRDSNGGVAIEVKVRVDEGGDVSTVAEAEAKAREIYDRMSADYPTSDGHDNAAISLTRNAKGETQIETTIRTADNGPQTLEAVMAKAWDTYDKTRARYPLSTGFTGKPGSAKGGTE